MEPQAVPRGSNQSGAGQHPTVTSHPACRPHHRSMRRGDACSAPSPFSRTVPLTLKGSGNLPSHKYMPKPPRGSRRRHLGLSPSNRPKQKISFTHGLPPPRTVFGDFCVFWRLHLGFLSPVAVDKEVAGSASYSGLSFLIPTCPRTADIFWRNIPVSASTEMRLRCHAEKHPEKNTPHTQVTLSTAEPSTRTQVRLIRKPRVLVIYPDSLCKGCGGETHRRRPARDSGLRRGSARTTHTMVGRSASSLPFVRHGFSTASVRRTLGTLSGALGFFSGT